MKVLKEDFPYRFVEVNSTLRIEKYHPVTKKYRAMYDCGCELQMLTALEDKEYVKWLDPDGVPCYRRQRGDTVVSPSRRRKDRD